MMWKKIRCWFSHSWEFDGGQWMSVDISMTTRKCTRCGLKQDIEHYHIFPNFTPGVPGQGVSFLSKERRPKDVNYNMKFEANARPTQ